VENVLKLLRSNFSYKMINYCNPTAFSEFTNSRMGKKTKAGAGEALSN
jgi:hypothetical protein